MVPWPYFRGMAEDDLRAIFAYLRTLAPVKHRVDNTEAFSLCRSADTGMDWKSTLVSSTAVSEHPVHHCRLGKQARFRKTHRGLERQSSEVLPLPRGRIEPLNNSAARQESSQGNP